MKYQRINYQNVIRLFGLYIMGGTEFARGKLLFNEIKLKLQSEK